MDNGSRFSVLKFENLNRKSNTEAVVYLSLVFCRIFEHFSTLYSDPSGDWGSLSVDNYDLGEVIGEGTFGQVFKATDRRTNHIVALKKVRQEKEKEGFPLTTVREIKILRQLNEHQNIIKLREIVSDPLNVDEYKRFKVNLKSQILRFFVIFP